MGRKDHAADRHPAGAAAFLPLAPSLPTKKRYKAG
jgi:hypothetical protein